jgi:hypothetical protein
VNRRFKTATGAPISEGLKESGTFFRSLRLLALGRKYRRLECKTLNRYNLIIIPIATTVPTTKSKDKKTENRTKQTDNAYKRTTPKLCIALLLLDSRRKSMMEETNMMLTETQNQEKRTTMGVNGVLTLTRTERERAGQGKKKRDEWVRGNIHGCKALPSAWTGQAKVRERPIFICEVTGIDGIPDSTCRGRPCCRSAR